MHAEIIERPALRTATLRHTGSHHLIGKTFDRLEPLAAAAGPAVPAGLTEITLAAARYAWTRHIGPYTGLGARWAWLKGEWLPSSGHRKGPGPSYEVYPNTMGNAAPEALITDIYIPVGS